MCAQLQQAVTSLGRRAEQALEGLPVSLFCVRPMTAPSCLQEGVWQNRPGGNTVQGLERYQALATACAPDGEGAVTSAARTTCRYSISENAQSSVPRKGCTSYHRVSFLDLASGFLCTLVLDQASQAREHLERVRP